MSDFDKYWRKIPNKYGVLLMLALTAFFLVMRLTGLGHEYWLRTFNIVILFSILWKALKTCKEASAASVYDDFYKFFKIGMRTSFIGIAGFAVLMAVYLDVIDPAFMEEVRQVEDLSPYLTPVTAGGIIFIEGFTSSFICTFIIIQILKRSTVEKPVEKDTEKH